MSKEVKDKEVNIVKKVCAELGINQKELADMLGVSTGAISLWAKGDIPKMAKLSLKQMLEIKELKEKLNTIKKAQEIINSI